MMLLSVLSAAPRSTTLKEAANESYEKCLKPYHGKENPQSLIFFVLFFFLFIITIITPNEARHPTAPLPYTTTRGVVLFVRPPPFRYSSFIATYTSFESGSSTGALRFGFFASSAFMVVLQFPPTREVFVESLGGEASYECMDKVVAGFKPTLDKIHQFLETNNLNDPTKV